jgi:hypothetical protein
MAAHSWIPREFKIHDFKTFHIQFIYFFSSRCCLREEAAAARCSSEKREKVYIAMLLESRKIANIKEAEKGERIAEISLARSLHVFILALERNKIVCSKQCARENRATSIRI